MKNIANVALMLNLCVAGIYAQPTPGRPVDMTVSGTAAGSTVNLGTGTPVSEYNFGGKGTLGRFTFRTISASEASTSLSSTCPSPKLYFAVITGAGVFRFEDGSLLKGVVTGGSACIDTVAKTALCIRVYQVTGGSDRFEGASGALTLTQTLVPVLVNASGPHLFATTGEITGTISGVAGEDEGQDKGQ